MMKVYPQPQEGHTYSGWQEIPDRLRWVERDGGLVLQQRFVFKTVLGSLHKEPEWRDVPTEQDED